MKTKTNKVPLVGPKGRKELLDRIEELEKKVIELENGGSSTQDSLEMYWPESNTISADSKQEFINALDITEEILDKILSKKIKSIVLKRDYTIRTFFINWIDEDTSSNPVDITLYYSGSDYDSETAVLAISQNDDSTYSFIIQN